MRAFLENCGIRSVRVNICSPGVGSGEQYVRENYPKEVKAFRSHLHAQPDTRLVVMTDADVLTVTQLLRNLEETLVANHLSERRPNEPIGIFIPKRNIETWIYFLMGQEVDESTVYRHLDRESECKPWVAELARNRRQPLPEAAPSSLRFACRELSLILPEGV